MRTWKTQFRLDWDLSPIEAQLLKLGFLDSSWGNDVSPSFENKAENLRVWVNFRSPDLREPPSSLLFAIEEIEPKKGFYLESDDFEAIVDGIDDYTTREW